MSTQQSIETVENALKYGYLPAFRNQITVTPSPFLEKVRKIPLVNNEIKAAAPYGLNGGFAFGSSDTSATPEAGAQGFVGFTLDSKNMYVNIEISDKAVRLGSGNASSLLSALDAEVKSAYGAANLNIGRALFGNGKGILTALSAAATSAKTVYVSDCRTLREGLLVDVYANESATASSKTPTVTGARVKAVSRKYESGKKGYAVTLDKEITASTALTAASETAVGTYGFLTVQKSYNNEICGLGAVMDDGIPTLYGVPKEGNDWLKPLVIDAGKKLDDLVLYEGIKQAQDFRNSQIDMILMGDKAFRAYQNAIRTTNAVITDKTMKFKGGAVGYTVLTGSREAVLVNERFVPEDEAWGVDTSAWQFHHSELGFASENGAGAFSLMEDKAVYRALLTMYGNLICEAPGGCVRFINCAEEA